MVRNVYQKRITKKDLLIGELVAREIENEGSVAELTTDELVKICESCSIEGEVEYNDKGKIIQKSMKYTDPKAGEFHGGTEPRAGQFYRSNIKSRLTGGKSTKLPTPIYDFAF